mgnify:FL=1
MRAEFTWNPGNPEATVQLLGAKEDPTTFRGTWKDKFLADSTLVTGDTLLSLGGEQNGIFNVRPPAELDGRAIKTAMELSQTVDDIRRQGQMLEVVWDELAYKGILTQFSRSFQTRRVVEWEMEFTWLGKVEPSVPAVFSVEINVLDIGTSWTGLLGSLLDSIAAPFAVISEFSDGIRSAANGIKLAVNKIQDTVAGIAMAIMSPIEAARALLGAIQSAKAAIGAMIGTIGSLPDQIIAGVAGLVDQANDIFGSDLSVPVTSSSALSGATGIASAPAQGAGSAGTGASPSAGAGASGASLPSLNSSSTGTLSGLRGRTVSSSAAAILVGVDKRVQAAVYKRGMLRVARQMLSAAARQEADLTKRVAPDMLSHFVARADMDLREVSTRFYGDQNGWRRLMSFNQLETSRLSAGQVVFVPSRDLAV